MSSKYTPIIGMEVHVELGTSAKMFCGCNAEHFQVAPNTHICPVCMGLPGALPVPNSKAIEGAIKVGVALGCEVNLTSKFDRKHYFYPDLPKGYQITQHDQPFCYSGSVTLGSGKKIRVTRAHLEEDTGKLIHKEVEGERVSLIDYNRSGVPLLEIVSEPDLGSAEEVKEYLKLLHATVRYLGVSDADMEKGSMRLEANISVSKNEVMPDYKVEVKNVNSFRYIAAAIDYEVERHIGLLEKGEVPAQETRGWSLDGKKTVSQRSKGEAKDYRYFIEPDIPPITVNSEQLADIRKQIPRLPVQVRDELIKEGVRPAYAESLWGNKELAEKALELVAEAKKRKIDVDKAVGVFVNSNATDFEVEKIIGQVEGEGQREFAGVGDVDGWVNEAIEANPDAVSDYKAGKETAVKFLVGQVMRLSKGAADPRELEGKIVEKLGGNQ